MQTAELVAGRELDVLVAEKVMGWEPYSGGYYYGTGGHVLVCLGREDGYIGDLDKAREWHPSTDIAAAWQVVEKLQIAVVPDGDGWWAVQTDIQSLGFTFALIEWKYADTAPLAICRAALATVSH